MKLLPILSLAAALFATTANAGEIVAHSGILYAPNEDGSFSSTTVGDDAMVFACVTDAATFATYANDSRSLYEAYLAGDFKTVEYQREQRTRSNPYGGYTDLNLGAYAEYGENYILMVATYHSAEFDRDYYIAKTIFETFTDDMDMFSDFEMYLHPTGWDYIPLDIRCTTLSLTDGSVNATYEISDYSRIGEISSYPNVNVVASADLSRTSPTNIPATIRSASETTGGAGILTLNFPCPPNFPTLFLFGLEKP